MSESRTSAPLTGTQREAIQAKADAADLYLKEAHAAAVESFLLHRDRLLKKEARPVYVVPDKNAKRVNVILPESLYAKVEKVSDADGVSIAKVLYAALTRFIETR